MLHVSSEGRARAIAIDFSAFIQLIVTRLNRFTIDDTPMLRGRVDQM
jgi:hypothetical protein